MPTLSLRCAFAACLLLPFDAAHAIDAGERRFGEADYRVVTIDLARERLELVWKDEAGAAYGGIEALRAAAARDGRRLVFATNAGIYDQSYRPLGLHVEGGNTLRPLNTTRLPGTKGNFSMHPNGVFFVGTDGKAGVVTTADWARAPRAARIASQSGPMLVIDGALHPQFGPASTSRKLRSGVCAPQPDRVAFAISEAPVNFHDFAMFMRDVLGCRDALFLDGTLSRFWVEGDPPAPAVKPYVGMFAVFEDAPAR